MLCDARTTAREHSTDQQHASKDETIDRADQTQVQTIRETEEAKQNKSQNITGSKVDKQKRSETR